MTIAKEYIDRIDFIYLFYLSFYVKRFFQWLRLDLITTDGIDFEIRNYPYPISIRTRYTCSVVHVGGPDAGTWMYTFADNFSTQGISARASDNISHGIESIKSAIMIIGI